MCPRRSNTWVKGGPLWTHAHTPLPPSQPLSHPRTHRAIHRRRCILCTHTQIRVSPTSPGGLPTGEEGWAKARGRNREPVSGRKPAEPWVVRCLGACVFSYSKMQHCRVGVGRFGINKRTKEPEENGRDGYERTGFGPRDRDVWAFTQRLGEEEKVQNRGNVSAVFLVWFGCGPCFGPQQCELRSCSSLMVRVGSTATGAPLV